MLAAHWSGLQYELAFSASAPRRLVLVAFEITRYEAREAEGTVLGFIVVRTIDQDWEIENIVVDTNWRRHGIATQLLNEIRKSAESESAMKIFLEVRQSNTGARRLYENCGFQTCGYRGQYYINPSEDAIVYQFVLQ
jgi:ribosomal-protein-alanine N-acetyltransferase